MRFVDKARIVIKAGDGGDGCASFYREKYVQRGGPDGGDGGRGGDLIFEASEGMSTLLDFKYNRHFRAQRGENGKAKLQYGKAGAPLVVMVPPGTLVRDIETGMIIADLHAPGKRKVVLFGGRGGKGNARFATPTRQAPRFAQNGQKVREREVELELQTIADVGLIGMPNVGKSTILSVLTSAAPKIANYHFTTLTPNLGVVKRYDKTFVLADIPGLIEGAAKGAGLGHDFLRHISRTRVLIHVVDISELEGRDAYEDYCAVNRELEQFSDRIGELPQVVAANKSDLTSSDENLKRFLKKAQGAHKVFTVSAATVEGFEPLLNEILKMLDEIPRRFVYEENEIPYEPQYEQGFEIQVEDDGVFAVSGGAIDKILDTTDPNDYESMQRFQRYLLKEGIVKALEERGAKEGDAIRLGEWEFDYIP